MLINWNTTSSSTPLKMERRGCTRQPVSRCCFSALRMKTMHKAGISRTSSRSFWNQVITLCMTPRTVVHWQSHFNTIVLNQFKSSTVVITSLTTKCGTHSASHSSATLFRSFKTYPKSAVSNSTNLLPSRIRFSTTSILTCIWSSSQTQAPSRNKSQRGNCYSKTCGITARSGLQLEPFSILARSKVITNWMSRRSSRCSRVQPNYCWHTIRTLIALGFKCAISWRNVMSTFSKRRIKEIRA